jgi:hypothetical protein
MQFTNTASLVASAGSLCFFDVLERKQSLAKLVVPIVSVLVVFCGAAAIRFGSGKLVGVLSIAFLLSKYLPRKDWWRLKVGLSVFGLAIALCCAVEFENRLYYERSGWSEFYPLNELRFSINECGRASHLSPKVVNAFRQIGWAPAEKDMFSSYCFLDRSIYSLQSLKKLDASLPAVRSLTVRPILSSIWTLLSDPTITLSAVSLLVALVVAERARLSVISRATFFLSLLGIAVFFLVMLKLPIYLLTGIICFSLTMLIWSAPASLPDLASSFTRTQIAASVAVLLLVMPCISAVKDFRQRTRRGNHARQSMRSSLNALDRKYLYVIWANALNYEAIRPFDNLSKYFGGLKLVGFCFLGRSPVTERRLQEFHIQDLLAEANNPQVRFISAIYLNDILERFYRRHFHHGLNFESVAGNESAGLAVYKVNVLPGYVEPASWDNWPLF